MADCCCPTRRHWLFLTCSLLVLLLLVETELASCKLTLLKRLLGMCKLTLRAKARNVGHGGLGT